MKKSSVSKHLSALILSSLIFSTPCALANDTSTELPEFALEQIVVTANKLPTEVFKTQANISVISREDLEKNHYTDLGDALKTVPGVNLQNYSASGDNYTSNRLYINGSDKIVVLIDGMRVNVNGSVSSVFSPSELSNMDTIERIEVLKGSASTLYGSDAVGGVINIITRKASKDSSTTSLSTIFGSADKRTYKIMNQGNANDYFWTFAAQKNELGDYKDGRGNKIIQDVDTDTYDLKLGKKFKDDSTLTFNYQKYKSDYIRPSSGGIKTATRNFGKKDNNKLSMSYQNKFSKNLSNQVSLYRNVNFLNDNYLNPGSVWLMDLETRGFSEQLTHTSKDHTVVAGFDYYQDRVNRYSSTSYGTTDAYQGIKLTNRAFYLQDEWRFAQNWTLTPGIRYHNHSEYGSNTAKSLTLGYLQNEKTNYYLSFKEFFVAPNQFQIYSKYGGKVLTPEKGDNIEFGVKHKFSDTTTVNFNAYERKADNMLAFNNTTVKYYNTGEEKSRGWSVDLSQELSKHLDLMVGYTHTTIGTETAKTYANRDGYIPTGAWNISLDYNQDKFNAVLSAKGILNRPGRKVNATKTASNLQSFWLYDLAFNYKANKNINTFIKINNLFDKFYTDQMYDMNPDGSWYSAQGRNIQVGVEYKF